LAAVASSAGKKDSIASSATVMSTAVPKVETVLKKESSPASVASRRVATISSAALRAERSGDSGPG
jgi:hypothetical protein